MCRLSETPVRFGAGPPLFAEEISLLEGFETTDVCNLGGEDPLILGSEEWKPVPGYEDLYIVSSFGAVRSLDRVVQPGNGAASYNRPGRTLKLQGADYPHVRLSHRGEIRTIRVHRIVCEAFHGPSPDGKPLVLHRDGNPQNNRAENLRWGTHVENEADKLHHGTNANLSKTHCPNNHRLVHPNLEAYGVRNGTRKCLACSREYALSRSQYRPFNSQLADNRYRRIMGEYA